MKTVKVCLNSIEAVRNFVEVVRQFEGDIDLSSGRYVVDAKSIMGIFALDTLSPITLVAHTNDASAFFERIKNFVV